MKPLLLACAALLCAPVAAPAALAQKTPVDVALVLAVDASGSIDPGEFRLQKEGIAQAITDREILSAIRTGPLQRIAIAYVEWGAPGGAENVVSWMVVDGEAGARRFADAVMAAPRSMQSFNAIGDAIDLGINMVRDCTCEPTRAVIDISGDNRDNRSFKPAPVARDHAVAAGITVNALAILDESRGGVDAGGRPWLAEYYERDVIGGPGSFVVTAQNRDDFKRALRHKLIREIAAGEAPTKFADRRD
ncbi:MAG: DUF1194 domain-containing protein [Rhodospirillaceae bacterium]